LAGTNSPKTYPSVIGSGLRLPTRRTASHRDHERGRAAAQPRSINATVPADQYAPLDCSTAEMVRAMMIRSSFNDQFST